MGPAKAGGFAIGRLMPMDSIWVIGGNVRFFGAKDRPAVQDFAVSLLKSFPRLPLRNPGKLESACAAVRTHHGIFLRKCGSHVFRGRGTEVIAAHRAVLEACRDELVGKGSTVPAHVLEDLANGYPDTVNEADRTALCAPSLNGERDGIKLLQSFKPTDFDDAHIPGMTTVPKSLQAVLTSRPAT